MSEDDEKEDGMDPEEFNELFGDDFQRRMEDVEMEETVKTIVDLFKGLKKGGLNMLEAAAVVAMLLRAMGIDDGHNQSDSQPEH